METESNDEKNEGRIDLSKSTGAASAPRRAYLLYLLSAGDAAMLMIISPWIPDFCKQRLGLPQERVGFASGIITGAFSLANAMSSPYVGHLSDTRLGRKPVLLAGALLSAVLTVGFPLAPTLATAAGLRFLAGLGNNNVVISRAYLADATRAAPPSVRALSFAYLGGAWGASRSLSAALSGMLVGVRVPGIAASEANPFLAPCVCMAMILFVVFCVAAVWLPESPRVEVVTRGSESGSKSLYKSLERLVTVGGVPLLQLLTAHAVHQWSNGGLLVLLVLLWSLPSGEGGAGLSTDLVGAYFAVFGMASLLFQLICFGPLVRIVGSRSMFRLGTLSSATGAALSSLSPYFAGSTLAHHVARLLLVLPIAVGFSCGLPVMGTLLSNTAAPEIQGLTHGTAQATGMIARAVGPVISGWLFGRALRWEVVGVPFWVISCAYVGCALVTSGLPDSVEGGAPCAVEERGGEEEQEMEELVERRGGG